MRKNLFWLSQEQWNRIEPRLPTDVGGVERADDRGVISGG
jgi:transposase